MKEAQIIHLSIDDPVTRRVVAEAIGATGRLVAGDKAVKDKNAVIIADSTGFAVVENSGDYALENILMLDKTRRVRIGTLLSRLASPSRRALMGVLGFGPYRLDLAYATLTRDDGETIVLTEKERDILMRLHAAAGGIIDRNALLDAVWGYADGVETHTLETHIYRLRRKIETDPADPRHLVTEGAGYRLVQ